VAKVNNLIFIFRRVLISIICMFMTSLSGLQIQLLLYLNLSILIYQGLCKPYSPNYLNKKELVNEFLIICISTIFLVFSDFCDNAEFAYHVGGWIYIFFFCMIIIFNLGFILVELFVNVRMSFKRYYKRFMLKVFNKRVWLNSNDISNTKNSSDSIPSLTSMVTKAHIDDSPAKTPELTPKTDKPEVDNFSKSIERLHRSLRQTFEKAPNILIINQGDSSSSNSGNESISIMSEKSKDLSSKEISPG
jgi:hypothetical protein